MSAAVRPDVVAGLLAILHDDALTTDARVRLVANADATPQERMAAAEAMARSSVEGLTELGVLHQVAPASVLDTPLRALQALAAAWAFIGHWDVVITNPDKRLGDVLKILPANDAEAAVRLLTAGGWLPPEGDG